MLKSCLTLLNAALPLAAAIIPPVTGAGIIFAGLSSTEADARTVCERNGRYHTRCYEVAGPIAPKPDPKGQQKK